MIADRLASLAVGIAIIYHVSRYLGVEGFGQFGLVQTFVPAFLVLSDFGISTVLLREMAIHGRDRAGLLGSVTLLRIGLGVVSVLACLGLARLLDYSGPLLWAIALYGCSLLLPPLETVGLVFRASVRNEYLVVASFSSLLAYGTGMWLAIESDLGLLGVTGALLASNAVRTGVTLWLASREVRLRLVPDVGEWRRLARLAAPLGVASLLGIVSGRLDMVVLSKLAPPAEMGVYSAASRFGIILAFFPQAFGSVLFPALSQASADRGEMARLYRQAIKVTAITGVFTAGFLSGNANTIIGFLFGRAFEGAAVPLRLIAWQYAVVFLNVLNGYTLIAAGRQRDNMVLDSIGVVVSASALLLLVPRLGATGAAISGLATHLVIALLATALLHYRAGCLPGGPLLAKTLLAGAVMLLAERWPVGGLVAGPIAYLGLLLAMGVLSIREIRRLIPLAGLAGAR